MVKILSNFGSVAAADVELVISNSGNLEYASITTSSLDLGMDHKILYSRCVKVVEANQPFVGAGDDHHSL